MALICGCAVVIALPVLRLNQNSAEPAPLLVDWSEWHGPAVDISYREEPTATASGSVGGDLRSLVYNCSRGLEIEGLQCGDDAFGRDDFRIPHFSSQPSCGFEVGASVDRARIVRFERVQTENQFLGWRTSNLHTASQHISQQLVAFVFQFCFC